MFNYNVIQIKIDWLKTWANLDWFCSANMWKVLITDYITNEIYYASNIHYFI